MNEKCKRPGCEGYIEPITNTCRKCGITPLNSSPHHGHASTSAVVLGSRCDGCNAVKSRQVVIDEKSKKTFWLCFNCFRKQEDRKFSHSDRRTWSQDELNRAQTLSKLYLEKLYYGEWDEDKETNEQILARELKGYSQYEQSKSFADISKNWTIDDHRRFFLGEVRKIGHSESIK